MSSTAQPTSITSPSSSQPTTSVVGVNSSSSTTFHNYNNHQFQPIQCQPLISSSRSSNGGAIGKVFDVSKVNTTATHIELEQQSNCNITTILNMSCRGRAEAFARSLQSRLRTLGSQEQDDTDVVDASSTWIGNTSTTNSNNTNNTEAITDLQPRLGVSQLNNVGAESADAYFDFDMEPESPGSPIDECEYTRLIETTVSTPQEPQAPESGFVCASPCSSTLENESRGSASSSDVQFFDPEASSDTGTEFYDCPVPESQSQQQPIQALPPAQRQRRVYHHLSHNRIAIKPPSPVASDDLSSSSSSATPTSKMNGHVILLESENSSESLPPSQSTTTTTTSNLNSQESSMSTANSNSNSTLQDAEESELPNEIVSEAIVNAIMTDCGVCSEEKCTLTNFDECKTHFDTCNAIGEDKSPVKEEELPPLEISAAIEPEPLQFDQEQILNEIQNKEEGEEEEKPLIKEEDSDYERLPRIRRCSSLKTGKTPPGTPGRKKSVRFADILGLDLADVRTFLDEVPKIPKSAYEDLDVTLPPNVPVQLGPPLDKVLVPLFQQPGCLPNFLDRLRDSQVCLENAAVTDPINLTITGCVRVRNLDFHKSVHIRYSLDSWRSYSDLSASYVENSCDGFSDKFSFILFGNSLQIGQRLEMALRFQVKGEQYWDNNYGLNYCFQCLPCNTLRTSPVMNSDSSLSESSDAATISESSSKSSDGPSSATTSHVDSLGHTQWSNSFLY